MGRIIPPFRMKCLNDGSPRRHETDFIADRESGLETVIFDADLPAFGGNGIACALYHAQPFPTTCVNRLTVALANESVLFKGDDRARRVLIEIVLDQFGNQIVTIKAKKIVPETRYPIGLGNELTFGSTSTVQIPGNRYVHGRLTHRIQKGSCLTEQVLSEV